MLLRPYHEMEGNWFWWGTNFLTDEQFIQLWQFTYNYLTQNKGLGNLVWVYGGNDSFNRYPGTQYVDIVGQDLYTSYPTEGQAAYDTMVATGIQSAPLYPSSDLPLHSLGKIVVLSEFGSGDPNGGDPNFAETTLIAAIKSTMPRSVYWLQWGDGNTASGMSILPITSFCYANLIYIFY